MPALPVREEVMAVLGHELRNPLSAIAALARGTMQRTTLPEDVRERLGHIDRAARRSLALVASLLGFAESRWRGVLPIRTVVAEPAVLAAAIVEEARAANPGRVITLDLGNVSSFVLDPLRIGQVLSNLITNALVHGFAHTPVRVTVHVDDGEAVFAVHNQGAPIPAEQVPALFEPFNQASERDAGDLGFPPARGLGLGLYIVHAIVTAHAGSVEVDSDSARGTTFRVRLPDQAG